MRTRAVLFDFDGTLADSYRAITASVNHVRAHRQLPPVTVDDVKPVVGRGLPQLLRSIVPGTDVMADARLYREHHPSVLQSGTDLLDGAMDALQRLHDSGLKLGICSNKPVAFTRTLTRTLGIAHLLDQVIGPEDVPEPKPAPYMLQEAMQRLGVSTEETVYVGDMCIDIETARAAGVIVWVVPTGSDTREALQAAAPDRLLNGLAELPELVA